MENKISLPTITENIYLEHIQIHLEEEKKEKKEEDISLIKKTIEINSEKMVKIGIQTGQIINPERLIDLDTEKKRIELDTSPPPPGIKYYYNGIYEGEFGNNPFAEEEDGEEYIREGKGIMQYTNGDIYEGKWDYDYKDGQGIMTYANGDVYEGYWYEDMLDGDGIIKYANGDVYTGELVAFLSNDDVYIRSIRGSSSHGMQYEDGTNRYTNGDLYEGEITPGEGTMQYANGDVYVGGWLNDLRHGYGTMTYQNGEVSRGEWGNNEYIGPMRPPHIEEDPGTYAMEVHAATYKINKKMEKYFEIIGSCPSVKEDNHYLNQPNIIDHIQNKLDVYIDKHYVKQEKEPLIEKLHAIFERIKLTTFIAEAHNRLLIGKTIDFVLAQEEDFIKFYLSVFSHDCYDAYSGNHEGMSCAKGILERFYLLIGDTAFALCPDMRMKPMKN